MRRLARPWTLACFVVMAVVALAFKSHYSGASAGDLAWILAPTAWLVGGVVGSDFVFEAGTGWLSREEMFAIAPECAGVNFLVAAFLTLAVASTLRLRSPRAKLGGLAASLAIAYGAAIAINTVRISIALRAGSLGDSMFDGGELHRTQGIAVFFIGLCALYLAADKLLPQGSSHAR